MQPLPPHFGGGHSPLLQVVVDLCLEGKIPRDPWSARRLFDDGTLIGASTLSWQFAPLGRMCMCLREILFRGLALQLIEPIDKIRTRLVIASEKQEDARTV